MSILIPTFNGLITLAENSFNLIGYLPKQQFPDLHDWTIKWRSHFAKGQLITGIMLVALGYTAHYALPALIKENYLSIPLQMVCIGLLYANHGAFNLARVYIEKAAIPGLTLCYDFYGRKVLPALNPAYDLQSHLYTRIKSVLDRVVFITFFPPQFAFKT